MDVGGDGGLLNLAVAGGDAAVADVVLDGVVEEHRVLWDHADVRSQRRLLHLGEGKGGRVSPPVSPPVMLSCTRPHLRYVLAVDGDTAPLNVVEAEDESNNGALPRA